jgi:hypothetical protein
MFVERGFLFVTHLSMSNLMGISSVLGQSKFEGLTLFRDADQERVDTMLYTSPH